MIQYNVTVVIDPEVHQDWLKWMQEVHVPEVMQTGCFLENKIARLLEPDQGNITYSIQYLLKDMATYDRYRSEFAPALQKDHTDRYQGKFVAFRTVLEVTSQQKV